MQSGEDGRDARSWPSSEQGLILIRGIGLLKFAGSTVRTYDSMGATSIVL